MRTALVLSLVIHALLLSLGFGGQDGASGLELPWREKRLDADDLHVILMPAQVTPAPAAVPAPPAWIAPLTDPRAQDRYTNPNCHCRRSKG